MEHAILPTTTPHIFYPVIFQDLCGAKSEQMDLKRMKRIR